MPAHAEKIVYNSWYWPGLGRARRKRFHIVLSEWVLIDFYLKLKASSLIICNFYPLRRGSTFFLSHLREPYGAASIAPM